MFEFGNITNYCEIKGYNLKQIESSLSSSTANSLDKMIPNITQMQDAQVALNFFNTLQECKKRSFNINGDEYKYKEQVAFGIVDRDKETKEINSFFNDELKILIEITGLQEIGKSLVIRKAISQSGYTNICYIKIFPTSSIDFLLYSIFKHSGIEFSPPYANYTQVFNGEEFKNALSTIELIIFNDTHNLTDKHAWRDALFGLRVPTLQQS